MAYEKEFEFLEHVLDAEMGDGDTVHAAIHRSEVHGRRALLTVHGPYSNSLSHMWNLDDEDMRRDCLQYLDTLLSAINGLLVRVHDVHSAATDLATEPTDEDCF